MNKFIYIIFIFILGCSLNSNSAFWSKSEKLKTDKKISKILFQDLKPNENEFNPKLKVNLPIKNMSINYNFNNNGFTTEQIAGENFSKYKFSKIENFSGFEPEILVDKENIYFFDDKGSIIKFNKNSKLQWKKNYYSKSDKKNNPILFLASEQNNLFIADTNANYYLLNKENGNLKWKKKHSSSFNSQIKIKEGKIFIVDMENTLRCFSVNNGEILWSAPTELTVVSSQKKQSLVLVKNLVIFTNSIGDLTAVDSNNGEIIWQTPTQVLGGSQHITLRNSEIVSDGETIFISNNNNEFFALDIRTGIIKWKQQINSEIRPAVVSNYIITISNEGLLVIINKNDGNILRINNILKNMKKKKRKEYYPVGFVISDNKIYLTTLNGRLFIINFLDASIYKVIKLDKEKLQTPVYFNKELYIAKDNSIIRIN
ncbi:PQQ-like beta-propeller repeat protein [Candidatus Pelagibacter sp.]|nr:PQQ-like beta-propeller repeat protein [Candidatus Pelagibacter sp.]